VSVNLRRPVPRLALRPEEAAVAIGMSPDAFAEHVKPHLRPTLVGSMRLYRIEELERFLAEQEVEGGRRAA
jgi:hypothetical protein